MAEAIIITSINPPSAGVRAIAAAARAVDARLVVIGDAKSPPSYELTGARFLSLDDQRRLGFRYAELAPVGSYARKNIGYLVAIRDGVDVIRETDDDNLPGEDFLRPAIRRQTAPRLTGAGWVNAYGYFRADDDRRPAIWPRGLPLDAIHARLPDYGTLETAEFDCPVQQGLADGDPDVDAVYRLTQPGETLFRRDRRLALGNGAWCPFNSQNTAWFRDAFPLLYLPATCGFRMTDIWRSLVAQRIAWANGWNILFHEPTVHQERNPHDLMRDFADEVSGYLWNRRIAADLEALTMEPGIAAIPRNMRACYGALIALGLIDPGELVLLDAWIADCSSQNDGSARSSDAFRG